MEFIHKSVLLKETIAALDIKPDGIYVDGTAGGAGHSSEIAKRLTSGFLYALDRDPDAVKTATERLKAYPAKVIESNFCDMATVLAAEGIDGVDGVLLDLGVSSYQLDSAERGFSYRADAPLDMRMSKSGLSAADIVNTYSVQQLTDIFRDYGEEKFAYKIANRIAKEREKEPILNTIRLADVIASSVPAAAPFPHRLDHSLRSDGLRQRQDLALHALPGPEPGIESLRHPACSQFLLESDLL